MRTRSGAGRPSPALSRLALPFALAVAFVGCNKTSGPLSSSQGSLSVGSLDFGEVPVGDSLTAALTLTNVGQAPLGVLGVSVQVGGSDYQVNASLLPLLLPIGAMTTVTVIFKPSVAGPRSGNLSFSIDVNGSTTAASGAVVSALSGQGVAPQDIQISVAPSSLDFQAQLVGTETSQSLTLTNPNSYPVTVVWALDGGLLGDGGALLVPASTGLPLAAGGQAELPVFFAPSQQGKASGVLAVAPCKACLQYHPPTVGLAGEGVDAKIAFAPAAVDFGFVFNGSSALSPVVTASYQGNLALTVVGFGTPANSVFSVANDSLGSSFPATLGGSGTAQFTFQIAYAPSGLPGGDVDRATLTYYLGDNKTQTYTATLTLAGDVLNGGCQLKLLPQRTIDFGTLALSATAQRNLRVINAGGSDCFLRQLAVDAGIAGYQLSLGDAGRQEALRVPAHGQLPAGGLALSFTAPALPLPGPVPPGALTFASSDPTQPIVNIALQAALIPVAGGSPWPTWHHDYANSGLSQYDTSGVDGGVAWSLDLTAPGLASYCAPAVSGFFSNGPVLGNDGTVYQVGCDGTLYELDSSFGAIRNARLLAQPNQGSFALATVGQKDALYLAYASDRGPLLSSAKAVENVYQFDRSTDLLVGGLTQVACPPNALLPLVADPPTATVTELPSGAAVIPFAGQCDSIVDADGGDNRLYDLFGTQFVNNPPVYFVTFPPGGILALNLPGASAEPVTGGAPFAPPFQPLSTLGPAIDAQGDLYWCSQGICSEFTATGKLLWTLSLEDGGSRLPLANAPALGGDALYVYDYLAVDAGAGAGAWTETGSVSALSRGVDGGAVVARFTLPAVALPDDAAAAYANGWAHTLSPALGPDGVVIVPYADGLYGVKFGSGADGGTATLAWKTALDGGCTGSPSVSSDGTIYLGTLRQGLVAIEPAKHAVRWAFAPSDGGLHSVSSTPALSPQGIVFTADNGSIYELR